MNMISMTSKDQVRGTLLNQQSTTVTPNLYAATSAAGMSNGDCSNGKYQSPHIPNICTPNFGFSGYPINPMLLQPMMASYVAPSTLAPTFDNIVAAAGMDPRSTSGILTRGTSGGNIDLYNLYRLSGKMGVGIQIPIMDPLSM